MKKFSMLLLLATFTSLNAAEIERAGIASAHPLATQAGHEILDQGGNAFDAAVAVSAVLAVVEPFSSGLGGGGFHLLHLAEDDVDVMIDGRETAPAAATADMYLDAEGNVDNSRVRVGALSAAIPGTPALLDHLTRHYGKLSLAQNLAPAIRLARDGFRMDARFATMIADNLAKLRTHCAPGCPFLRDDREPIPEGAMFRQPELANTLQAIATHSSRVFYRGELAARLVAGVRARGGIWTQDDLANYRVRERDVLHAMYKGHKIITASPPSSGGITLIETLNILDGLPLGTASTDQRVHWIAETWRLSYRDRNDWLGDPDFVTMPIARLLSPNYAAGLRAGIRADRTTPSATLPPVTASKEGLHTSHYSIIDKDGNRVAATQTVNFRFGGAIVPPGTGVVLNNEMDDFTAKPGVPNGFGLVQGDANVVAPGKRPLSSMAPTFIESPRGVAVLGTPGGSRIISMVTLAILDYVAGGDAASMTALPRFHHQYLPDHIEFERGALDVETLQALRQRGHGLKENRARWGNMNIVTWDRATGRVETATDPRNEVRVEF